MSDETAVESPCNGVCQMDPSTGFCLGCFRTKEEIKGWEQASNKERLAIIDRIVIRQDDMY